MPKEIAATIDEYIAGYPPEIQSIMEELRAVIRKAAPEAQEKISWGMATFTLYGNLVHFSGEKKHIGFHPAPSAIETFSEQLADYKYSKGTIQFPYDKPIPMELIEQIVTFRAAEQIAREETKKSAPAGTVKIPATQRARYPMPEYIESALMAERLKDAYDSRPPYQRNDYIGWVTRAKRPDTRQKRLDQMLEELRSGDAYMGMSWKRS